MNFKLECPNWILNAEIKAPNKIKPDSWNDSHTENVSSFADAHGRMAKFILCEVCNVCIEVP